MMPFGFRIGRAAGPGGGRGDRLFSVPVRSRKEDSVGFAWGRYRFGPDTFVMRTNRLDYQDDAASPGPSGRR
jgi:hypothetical protein